MLLQHKAPTLIRFHWAFTAAVAFTLSVLVADCSQPLQEVGTPPSNQNTPAASTVLPPSFTPQKTHSDAAAGANTSPLVAGESVISSPYAGQETREIKALSTKDIEGLLSGAGTPYGGMAKPAELNGYPGPRHVLDAVSAGEFEVTLEQREKIESLFESMRSQAIVIGEEIVELETEVDVALAMRTITTELLRENILEVGQLYGRLRLVHLETHLSMMDIMTEDQVDRYNRLRGYTSGNPCDNIPKGHPPEMWKKHNNCS